MITNAPNFRAKACVCIAAATACAILSAPVQAKEPTVKVQVSVSTAGLELSQPAAARELYGRLYKAAVAVCDNSLRVGLRPVIDFASCREQALADAVRSADRPQLTLIYMGTRTLQDAANHGIAIPTLIVVK